MVPSNSGPRDRRTEVSNAGKRRHGAKFYCHLDALLSLRYRSRPVLERYPATQPRGENSPRGSSRLFSSISRECTLSVHSRGTVAGPGIPTVRREYYRYTGNRYIAEGVSQKVCRR